MSYRVSTADPYYFEPPCFELTEREIWELEMDGWEDLSEERPPVPNLEPVWQRGVTPF